MGTEITEAEVDKVTGLYADRFKLNPDHIVVDYKRGTISVQADLLLALLLKDVMSP